MSYASWKSKQRSQHGIELEERLIKLEKQLNNGIDIYTEYSAVKQESQV